MIMIAFAAFLALVLAWLLAPIETAPRESTVQPVLPQPFGETFGASS